VSTSPDDTRARTVAQPPSGSSPPTVPGGGTTQPGPSADGPPAEARPAWQIPGYRVLRELARGGMGLVLAAHDEKFDREVAVKVLLNPLAGSPAAERFVQEARITARLPHPGIPPVHDLGELPDGTPFLAMKLIRGQTLADLLKERPAPSADLPRFVGIFEQVCQAVAFAHDHGVIHRDLKPHNVMVGAFGEVQVMDWGLAKEGARSPEPDATEAAGCGVAPPVGAGSGEHTEPGSALGTPAYMPPEQARGAWDRVGPHSDVFALGGILCAILTGQPPYPVGDSAAVLRQAAAADLAGARARLDGCGADAELVALAKRCLSPEPAGRPADAGGVAAAVAAYRSGVERRLREAETERAAAEARAAEQRKRRRVQVLLAGAVAGVVGLLAFGLWWRDRHEMEHRAEVARLEGDRKAEAVALAKEREFEARQRVAAALALAARLRDEGRFPAAEAALDQVADLAAAHPGELKAAVGAARADLGFVRDLAAVRAGRVTWNARVRRLETTSAPPAYRAAFAARGFDFAAGDPQALADRARASAVSRALVAALDDWAVHDPDAAVRDRLLAVLRKADPGPWLDAFRDPAARRNRMALGLLARSADPAAVPPAAVVALAELMEARGLDPGAVLAAAHARHPADYDLALQLGLWFHTRDELLAAGYYWAARAARPADTVALGNLGALLTRGDPPGVTVVLTREAVRLTPTDPMAHYNLGVALHKARDLAGAIACYREATRLDPTDPEVLINLGAALGDSGDRAGAVAVLRRAAELAPRDAAAHFNLGVALERVGDVDGMIRCYREAIRLDPKAVVPRVKLGDALSKRGEHAEAVAALREAVRLAPRSTDARNTLAFALQRQGDFDGALAEYREVTRLNPSLAAAHHNVGFLLARRDDLAGAEAAYREALRLDPQMAVTRYELGKVLQKLGDGGAATAEWREAARLRPERYANLLQRLPLRPLAPPPRVVTR